MTANRVRPSMRPLVTWVLDRATGWRPGRSSRTASSRVCDAHHADMVGNLLVVLCEAQATQPVADTGTRYGCGAS